MFGVGLQFLFLLTSGVTLGQEHDAVNRVVVPEGGDAVLPLSIGRNAEGDYFDWRRVGPGGGTLHEVFKYDAGDHYNNGQPGQSEQFKGRVSHFPAELKHGNTSIVIRKTTAADAGNYICGFPRLKPSQTFYFNLAVAATPKPSVTILTATADRALLQCEVPGASLNTKAEWQSRDGNRLNAEEERVPEKDHVFISLSVNVTRTDLYLCVVSHEDIKHRVSAQISVFINEKESTKTVAIVGITLVVSSAVIIVAVVAVVAFLVCGKCIIILHNKGSALKGKYMIYMDDGLIIDISKQLPQSVEGTRKVVVPEGEDAVLQLYIGRNAETLQFEWRIVSPEGRTLHQVFLYNTGPHYINSLPDQSAQFKGRVSHFPAELKDGKASIVIRKTTAADTGIYCCSFPRLKPSKLFQFNLAVDTRLQGEEEIFNMDNGLEEEPLRSDEC